jgi:hypothetical protein
LFIRPSVRLFILSFIYLFIYLSIKNQQTCTVALGSQAKGMKILSFMLKSVPNTAKKATKQRTTSPIHKTATPLPKKTKQKQKQIKTSQS